MMQMLGNFGEKRKLNIILFHWRIKAEGGKWEHVPQGAALGVH